MLKFHLQEKYSPNFIWTMIGMSLVVHFLSLWANHTIFEGQRWIHIPLHTGIEICGALIAIMVGLLLLSLNQLNEGTSFNRMIAAALFGMAILDAFHAVVPLGKLFIWLHSTAIFVGGLLFVCVWFPVGLQASFTWWIPGICISTSLFGAGSLAFPELIPSMVEQGKFTLLAHSLNMIGGGCLFVSAIRLILTFTCTKQPDDLLFSLHCLLFGAAAIMFQESALWDSAWWGWHILRFAAFGVALWFIVFTFHNVQKKAQAKLHEANQSLEYRVKVHMDGLKKTTHDMQEISRRQEAILQAAGEGIYGLALDGTTTFVNPAAARLLHYKSNDLLGRPMHSTIHHTHSDGSPFPRENCRMLATLRDGESHHVEDEVFWCKDGSSFQAEYMSTPIYDGDGKVEGAVVTFKDITNRKQREAQLSLTQKMESIGQLAAGIAHEINTPTQFVSDNLRFLSESFGEIQKVLNAYEAVIQATPRAALDARLVESMETTLAEADLAYVSQEIPKALQQSLDGSERVGKIVRAMKEFSHPGNSEKKPVDLNQAIESTITVARNEWKYVAKMITDLDATLPLIPCLPGEFNQVILNVLINAAHAIGSAMEPESEAKGTITVTTRQAGGFVEVRITDTGMGIPEAVHKKIFDPFFTTKEIGKGTGQGLAIAHDVIVNKHGGHLSFESIIGQGTTFIIQLPCPQTNEEKDMDETTNLVRR